MGVDGGDHALKHDFHYYNQKLAINPTYLTDEYIESVKKGLKGDGPTALPFPHFSLDDFIQDREILQDIKAEMERCNWKVKENDMYTMKRTVDIFSYDISSFPALRAFRNFLFTKVRDFLEKATGVKLANRVDCAGSLYEQYDVLLPHDDRNEERKFAFIFYLTQDWDEAWGGCLRLYNADEKHYPTDLAKRIVPKDNAFLFFDINQTPGHTSWHAVEEVTERGKRRLSLNGWFHIDNLGEVRTIEKLPTLPKIPPIEETNYEEVRAFINASYIANSEQKRIKKIFARKSELQLSNFLTEEKYDAVLSELKAAQFTAAGPVNQRNINRLDESKLEPSSNIASLLRLVRSEAMTLLITQWTGLHLFDLKLLHENEEDGSPASKKPKIEATKRDVQVVASFDKYSYGSYSLCDDQMAADGANNGFCFDLHIFFIDKPWNEDAGGYISYIAAHEPNEILRVHPMPNSSAFVFREPDVLNFTKYVNSRAIDNNYYVLSCSYFGVSSMESDSESSTTASNADGEDLEDELLPVEPEDDDDEGEDCEDEDDDEFEDEEEEMSDSSSDENCR